MSETQLNPKILSAYNRLRTYRPHLTEAARFKLVQKDIEKGLGVKLESDYIKSVVQKDRTSGKSDLKKPEFIKKEITYSQWCLNAVPSDVKRDYVNPNVKKPLNFTFKGSSSIPRPVFKFGHEKCDFGRNCSMTRCKVKVANQAATIGKAVFDRLYELRPRPCPETVKCVKRIHDSEITNKRPPKPIACPAHEPPSKRGRYSQNCLNGTLNSSVFDRLYAERKQWNTKQLTDVEKRELYLLEQRKKRQKAKQQANKENKRTKAYCRCYATSTSSPTSDLCESLETISDISDILKIENINFNDTPPTINEADLSSDDIFNSTVIPREPSGSIRDLVHTDTSRFLEQRSLCLIDEKDYAD